MQIPHHCTLCPRACGADRAAGQHGFCGADNTLRVARAALHHWEEPCLSGDPNAETGSGTVFFSGCTLKCCYCQNYPISQGEVGKAISVERLTEIFMNLQNGGAKSAMRLTVMSFGFKFGVPADADLVLDVRCLPNPFYVPDLKFKTGLDQEVVDFVMGKPEAQELLRRYEAFLEYALPLYVKEGKSQLTIAVGCTGGKHRSITFARKIAEYCKQLGYQTGIQHRDAAR